MALSPSVGERAAISGYTAQYLIAADLIHEQIQSGTLEWVQLVDPDAGRVDDVIIATPGWINACQIKWTQSKSAYTFTGLTSGTTKKPSIWNQLSEGWLALKSAYPDRQVRVAFVTNEIASPNIKLQQADGSKTTFQEVWAEVLVPLSRGTLRLTSVPPKYATTIEQLQTQTTFADERFAEFICNCRLQFDRPDPRQTLRDDLRRSGELADIEQLAAYLQKRVALARAVIRIGREELLNDLGWEIRLSQRFSHSFRIDETLYRAIEPTVSQLQHAISSRQFGYIALLGGPGSGKSTTLSHNLRYQNNIRLISYYAYLRDDLATGRGEAANFWQDLYLAIRHRGISPPGSMPRSASEFRKGVGEQLAMLSEDWKNNGVLTVFLIDGLDHIDREQNPTESLIAQLPLPEQIPPGVVIFLGSQTLNLRGLAPAITTQLAEAGRTIQMGRLSRTDVFGICESSRLPVTLTTEQKEKIFALAAGYPLATVYLLSRLMALNGQSEIDALLNSENSFSGNIESVYASYWEAIDDIKIPELLSLLCRMRVSFDIKDAVNWVPGLDAKSFVRQTKHFFHAVEKNRLSFFHNSFRQYLLRRTSEDILGERDDGQNRKLHLRLAEIAAQHDPQSIFGREVLFHQFEAGEYVAVLALGTQDTFRRQFFALRNLDQISDDIGLVVRAARETVDGIGLVRALLIDRELREREWCLENSSFRPSIDAFLDDEKLIEAVRDQNKLIVSRDQAMGVAKRIVHSHPSEAKGIFELAEPLDLLSGVEKVELRNGHKKFLRDWLNVAFYFRAPSAIAEAIGNLVVDHHDDSEAQEVTNRLRNTLLVTLGTLTYQKNQTAWDELQVHPAVVPFQTDFVSQVDWALVDGTKAPDVRAAALNRLLQDLKVEEIHISDRLFLAETMLRLDFDSQRIRNVVTGIAQPALADTSGNFSNSHRKRFSIFAHRFRFNRLNSALGTPIAPTTAVPWPAERNSWCGARFERMLVVIANVWGAAQGNRIQDDATVIFNLKDALRVFYNTDENSLPASSWYFYRGLADIYFEYLILAVSAHGESQLDALGKEFDRIWFVNEPRSAWPADIRRSIATSLFKNDGRRDNLISRLEAISGDELNDDDLRSRIDSLIESARSWKLASMPERAASLLETTLHTSFGIHHHKDRQIQEWVDWLDRATMAGVTDPFQECSRFGAALATIVALDRGRGDQDAAAHLLAIATRASPEFGLQLRDQLFESATVGYGSAMQGILHGALERPDISPIRIVEYLSHVGVAIELPDVQPLLTSLVILLASREGNKNVPIILETLIHGVLTQEFKTARRAWFRGLHTGCQRAGVEWPHLKWLFENEAEISNSTPMKVKLKDGTSILDSDFEKSIVTFDTLKTAIEAAEPDAYVRWDRAADGIIAAASREQLTVMSQWLDSMRSREHLVAAKIIRRLAALGDLNAAEAMANRLLLTSPSHGWIEHFDGGTRLFIAQALAEIKPNRRPELFQLLADDYLGGLRNPKELVSGLEDLLPIIFGEIPWASLWQEIREHVGHLSEFRESEPLRLGKIRDWGSTAMLVDASVRDFQLPIPEYETRFARLLACWLGTTETSELAGESLQHALEAGMLDSQAIVPLYLAKEAPTRSTHFKNLVDTLTASRDISVRISARSIQSQKVTPDQLIQSPAGDAPILFSLALNTTVPTPSLFSLSPEFVQESHSKPIGFADFFCIQMEVLKLLARVTDIPIQNLLQRAQQIADKDLEQSRWGQDPENCIRSYLSGIGLKITFRRPWAEAAEIAFFCLVAELIDFGYLDAEYVIEMNLGRFFDEGLMRAAVMPRPTPWVINISDRSVSSDAHAWVENIVTDQNPSAFYPALLEGFVVLAEYTKLVRHEWEMPEERRVTVLRHPGAPAQGTIERLDLLIPGFQHNLTTQYPDRLNSPIEPKVMAIGEHEYSLRLGPQRWFALNPEFARRCGLALVSSEDFAWVNGKGEVVARTIHWQDGPGRRQPPMLDEVFGEGWLVTIRRDALCYAFNSATFQLDSYVTRKASSRGSHNDQTIKERHFSEIVTL